MKLHYAFYISCWDTKSSDLTDSTLGYIHEAFPTSRTCLHTDMQYVHVAVLCRFCPKKVDFAYPMLSVFVLF